ncbi:hypothetical protein M0R45_013115 [Rubus argutus]|uniref:Ribosomal RNA-processing protein 17 n=1 Tax=Rubus argutus TaxID=59490 RepID=A0AAW1XJ59_RUBAR
MAADKVEDAAIPASVPRGRYINKRALKNKAVAVTFNEKDLSDFVSGFHKRKKKRRKEAEKKQGEALRRKILELRKKRRLEKELALFGGVPQATNSAPDENDEEDENQEEDEESEPDAPISGTTTYENGDIKVTVTTSEISREEEINPVEKTEAIVPETVGANKKNNVPVSKKKPFKKVGKRKSGPKMQKKRDKRKGKEKSTKRR